MSNDGIIERDVQVNKRRLHVAEAGEGPLMILCHGFPGSWRTWQRQLPVIAEAGWHAVALDMPGYGGSSRPEELSGYANEAVGADLVALVHQLGAERAVFAGHDFGANLVWDMALRYPEAFIGAFVVSVPFAGRSPVRPTEAFAAMSRDHFLHLDYFQTPGVADAELNAAPQEFLRRIYWALSSDGGYFAVFTHPTEGNGYLDVLPPAPPLPWPWLSLEEFEAIAAGYRQSGFTGGLSWYRAMDLNWERSEHLARAKIEVPVTFVVGAGDPVLQGFAGSDPLALLAKLVPGLREAVVIPDAGHFVQLEKTEPFNEVLRRSLAAWQPSEADS
jgi:pimeloyl-ACP methyl ester carboxylesterase